MYIEELKTDGQLLLNDLPKTNLIIKNNEWGNTLNSWIVDGKEVLSRLISYLCCFNGSIEINNLTFMPLSCTCTDKGGQEISILLDYNNSNPTITIKEPSILRTYECEYYKGQGFITLKLISAIFYEKTNYFGRNITDSLIEFTFKKDNIYGNIQISRENNKDDRHLLPHEKEFKEKLMDLSDLSSNKIKKLFTKTIGSANKLKVFSINVLTKYKHCEITDCLELRKGKLSKLSVSIKVKKESSLYESLKGQNVIVFFDEPLSMTPQPFKRERALIKQAKKARI